MMNLNHLGRFFAVTVCVALYLSVPLAGFLQSADPAAQAPPCCCALAGDSPCSRCSMALPSREVMGARCTLFASPAASGSFLRAACARPVEKLQPPRYAPHMGTAFWLRLAAIRRSGPQRDPRALYSLVSSPPDKIPIS